LTIAISQLSINALKKALFWYIVFASSASFPTASILFEPDRRRNSREHFGLSWLHAPTNGIAAGLKFEFAAPPRFRTAATLVSVKTQGARLQEVV